MEPVGSVSGLTGTPAGAFGGSGDDPASRIADPFGAASPGEAAFVCGALPLSGADSAEGGLPAAPPGEIADDSG
jgi:hypothetical protein